MNTSFQIGETNSVQSFDEVSIVEIDDPSLENGYRIIYDREVRIY